MNAVRHRAAALVLSALALAPVAGAARAASGPPAPRVESRETRLEQAGALLDERASWNEAIARYRALAAEAPDWPAPRHQLARVLAWRGDYTESLALYDALRAAPGAPPEAVVERAEVLSWAGRNEEAGAAFESLLAERPDDARAARGLARVHRWSGRRAEADRWYARALAREDDPEARQEWSALRGELARGPALHARWFRDSDHFVYLRSEARFELDLDFDTRLRFASGATRASVDDWDPGSRFAGDPEHDRAFDARAGVERRLGPRSRGALELGARAWEHGSARPLARVALDFSPDERRAVHFELRHDDLLERSFSLASALAGIGDTTAAASLWQQVSPRFEAWSGVEGSTFTDGNGQGSAAASVAWRPWLARDLRVGLAGGVGHSFRASDFYYAPDLDASGTLSVSGKLPIRGALVFAFDLGAGLGYAEERGESGFGPAWRAKAGLGYRRGRFALSLDAAHSRSQRGTDYTTHELQLALGWAF